VTIKTDIDRRLLAVLRDTTGLPALAYARQPESLSGGFWAELMAFSLVDAPAGWPRDLVARMMPDAAVARKETIIQAAVAATGFPTPPVRAAGGEESGLGRAFMVMDRASGAALLPSLSGPAALAGGIRMARRIPDVLASAMAGLHALDPAPVMDKLRQAGAAPVTIDGMLEVIAELAAGYQRPDLAAACGWLIRHPVPPTPDVICHGDLHPFNLLADDAQITVLDWSAALLAPRAYDVAFTALMLSEPPLQVPGQVRPLVRWIGRRLARHFVRRYQAHAGTPIGAAELRWHQAVVCLRALADVASWAHGGELSHREGHPWLITGQEMAALLSEVTGTAVRPR
jgi:aminoglycoside phosphotransferase (APT) family kinase protein